MKKSEWLLLPIAIYFIQIQVAKLTLLHTCPDLLATCIVSRFFFFATFQVFFLLHLSLRCSRRSQAHSDGGGLWATEDLTMDESMPLFVQGHFEVASPRELLEAVMLDHIPRFPVLCDLDSVCTDEEKGSVKGKFLHPSCFLYYMNSSCDSGVDENLRRKSIFETKLPTKDTARGLLVDADSGIAFEIKREVKKGEELLHFFPGARKKSGPGSIGMEESEAGGSMSSPTRRSKRVASARG